MKERGNSAFFHNPTVENRQAERLRDLLVDSA